MSEENKHTCDCGHDHMEEELDNIIKNIKQKIEL